MRIFIIFLITVSYGCKTTNHQRSESQSWRAIDKIREALPKLSELAQSSPVKKAIKKAVDTDDLEDLKKLLKQGEAMSEAVSSSFYRTFKEKELKVLSHLTMRESSMFSSISDPKTDAQVVIRITEVVEDFLPTMKKRNKQTATLINSIPPNNVDDGVSSDRLKLAFNLCCRRDGPYTGPITKDALEKALDYENSSMESKMYFLKYAHSRLSNELKKPGVMPSYFHPEANEVMRELKFANRELETALNDFKTLVLKAVETANPK